MDGYNQGMFVCNMDNVREDLATLYADALSINSRSMEICKEMEGSRTEVEDWDSYESDPKSEDDPD